MLNTIKDNKYAGTALWIFCTVGFKKLDIPTVPILYNFAMKMSLVRNP
jgi:hypothetical protein